MGKIGPKFSHLLTVRAEGPDPPLPPYGQPDRKKTVFFDDRPNLWSENVMNVKLFKVGKNLSNFLWIPDIFDDLWQGA